MNISYPIDFVLTWVDDSDPVWRAKKAEYTGLEIKEENRDVRYRDWDTLKYWFRGVEKFAPWVRHVYFVTDDQKPEWLNIDHPKLKWVKHTDYIPKEYLPTFNSHTIEWNLHCIEDLSEHFVYFNDDMFLINETTPEDFFVDGQPCDYPQLVHLNQKNNFLHILVNNYLLMQRNFSIKTGMKKNPMPWLRAQKVKFLAEILLFGSHHLLLRLKDWHIQISFKKEYFQKLWDAEYEVLHKTCSNKARTIGDVSCWCVREWQLLSNDFHLKKPIGQHFSTYGMSDNNSAIEYIKKQKGKTICLNDTEQENDFELHKQMIIDAFEELLPDRSSFEL